jgi:hypothetical protein
VKRSSTRTSSSRYEASSPDQLLKRRRTRWKISAPTIEDVLLRHVGIRSATQDFPVIATTTEIKADGQMHFGAVSIAVHFQIYEAFDPDVTTSLQELSLTADLRNVYDPSGTYPNPPFPDAVQPAPRTSGPDGRAEGGFDIELPQ